jgi:hypothetical protein
MLESTTSVLLEWEMPRRGQDFITYFEVDIMKGSSDPQMQLVQKALKGVKKNKKPGSGEGAECTFMKCIWRTVSDLPSHKNTFNVTNLEKTTEYFFRISVYSPWGRSAFSKISVPIKTTMCQPGFQLVPGAHKLCYYEIPCARECEPCPLGTAKGEFKH